MDVALAAREDRDTTHGGAMEAGTGTVSREQVKNRIVAALVEFGAEEDELKPEAKLKDVDVDSLDLFEVGQILQQEYGLTVDPEEFEGVETLGEALDILMRGVDA
jgi:acyl carrier protein